jgi:uncharacterized membrane protein
MVSFVRKKFRTYLLAGILILVPLSITLWILNFLFRTLDNLLMPFFIRLLGYAGWQVSPDFRIPGVGLLATLLIIVTAGVLTTNIIGRKVVDFGERTLVRIPLASNIYFASKQMVEALSQQGRRTFHQVVMVEYPRLGVYSVGLMTKENAHVYRDGLEPMVTVFMPTTPNPTSGLLILVRREDVYPLPLTVEEGIKFVVSGGLILPQNDLPEGAGEAPESL